MVKLTGKMPKCECFVVRPRMARGTTPSFFVCGYFFGSASGASTCGAVGIAVRLFVAKVVFLHQYGTRQLG